MNTSENRNELIDVNRIKDLVAGTGLSKAAFGRKVGLERREAISVRLRNECTITGDELIRMARELNVPVDDLAIK